MKFISSDALKEKMVQKIGGSKSPKSPPKDTAIINSPTKEPEHSDLPVSRTQQSMTNLEPVPPQIEEEKKGVSTSRRKKSRETDSRQSVV